MSYHNGPKIVSEGLVLCVDSGNSNSYPGSGTTWFDLNQTHNLTITGATYSSVYKSLLFSNSTNNFSAANYALKTTQDSTFALNLLNGRSAFVFFYNTTYLDAAAPGYFRQIPMSFGADSSLGGWQIERFTTETNFNLRYKFDQEDVYGNNISYGTVPINQWQCLGWTLNSNQLLLYKNGVQVNSLSVLSKTLNGTITADARFGIGSSGYTGTPFYGYIGYISHASFYNRTLSANEVLQNYNALRGRFGL